jgi:anaerobic ribonucleoside-triphosphate reductase activating protein
MIIKHVKERLPDVPVYIWTGYTYEQILSSSNPRLKAILELTDYIIDGPYIEAERDITLPMRGSRNQRVIKIDKK